MVTEYGAQVEHLRNARAVLSSDDLQARVEQWGDALRSFRDMLQQLAASPDATDRAAAVASLDKAAQLDVELRALSTLLA